MINPSNRPDEVNDSSDDGADRKTGNGSKQPGRDSAGTGTETSDVLAAKYAARAGVQRNDSGQIDVLTSIGGVRGLTESILPGLVFTVIFTITRDLQISLIAAVAIAAVLSVARLIAKSPLTQALSGLVGVVICAVVAMRTGEAEDYFLPGFYINAAYILAMLISLAVRWPVAGLLFGLIRGENLDWRKDARRIKAYSIATWLIIAVLALRLAVQLPLYFADNIAALGASRVIMGLPLYALGLWLAWLVSRPAAVNPGIAEDPGKIQDVR